MSNEQIVENVINTVIVEELRDEIFLKRLVIHLFLLP